MTSPPEMSVVERADRAAAMEFQRQLMGAPKDGADIDTKAIARAVIQSLREPSEGMLRATVDERGTPRILEFTTPEERGQPFLMARYSWRAMIDSILNEEDR